MVPELSPMAGDDWHQRVEGAFLSPLRLVGVGLGSIRFQSPTKSHLTNLFCVLTSSCAGPEKKTPTCRSRYPPDGAFLHIIFDLSL